MFSTIKKIKIIKIKIFQNLFQLSRKAKEITFKIKRKTKGCQKKTLCFSAKKLFRSSLEKFVEKFSK